MFQRERVIDALEAKADRFIGYEVQLSDALRAYEQLLSAVASLTYAEVKDRLAGQSEPGALPTDEHDRYAGLVVPFEPARQWTNHEEAREWARRTLVGVTTAAVDGSQITPSKDLSVPVGAVQVGWFVNPHAPDVPYLKDLSFEVLAPDELADGEDDAFGFPDWRVNQRRFVGECQQLIALMEAAADSPRRMVCFLDGSLIVSFVQHMLPERQLEYIGAIKGLLDASERCRIPLVGYVDTSYANDLAAMLDTLGGRRTTRRISDGALFRQKLMWGDRTTAHVCARRDGVVTLEGSKYYERVVFVYLKATTDGPPARLDVPRWVLESGELDSVLDIVRAECIVGTGYPYASETADAVAVITQKDRDRFYRLFQEFAEKRSVPLRLSRKSTSKRGRRA